jgi:HEAT repeat protein
VEQLLRKIVEDFEAQPATSRRLMRELLEKDGSGFAVAARSVLRQTVDHRGYRYLIALLAGNNMLAKCMCDPALSPTAALSLARIGIQVDPSLDASLARELAEGLAGDKRGESQALRILNLLGEISRGSRLVAWLSSALRHSNGRIRSKAALLIGRRSQNLRWVEQPKEDLDPRVRANAIEGLWGMQDEGSRNALWDASRDAHNRVAGNALLGLHRLGDPRVIDPILAMAAHAEPRFRATAAWVMGESEDPRFLGLLGRMLADRDGVVRTRAFRSLARVRQRTAALEPIGGLRVHLWEARRLSGGERRLSVACVHRDGVLPDIAGTEFMVSEGDRPVTAYQVRRRPRPALTVVGFGLPRVGDAEATAVETMLRELLAFKKPDHSWALARYSPERLEAESTAQAPRFSTKAEVFKESLEKRPLRVDAASGLLGAARLLLSAAVLLQGERHLVLVALPRSRAGREAELAAIADTARYHGVAVHGLSIGEGDAEALRLLAESTGGRLLQVGDDGAAQMALRRIFWGLQSQHEIHYRIPAGTDESAVARVQVCSELGMAEDSLMLA